MSPDPYDGSYNLYNPQSLNRYSYALNNPFAFTDPSGMVVPSTCDDPSIVCFDGGDGDGGGDGGCPVDACVTANPDPPIDPTDPGTCVVDCTIPTNPNPTPSAPNNAEPPPPCQAKILNATHKQFGTNFTDANVSSTFNYSTGAGPGQGTLNLNITGSTAGVSPGYYPVHWYSYIIGYGSTLHVVSGPGGNGGLDDATHTFQFGPNQGTFHIDSAFPHNPFGAIIHGIMNMTKLAGYPKC